MRDDTFSVVIMRSTLGKTYKSFGRMLAPARDFLLAIKAKHKVDVFCGYRSNCNHAGFQVEPKSLAIFAALDIPFGVSVIVVP